MPPTKGPTAVLHRGGATFGDLAGLLGLDQQPVTTGNTYFVHSGTGADTNTGTDKDSPLATIDAAVGKCTASQGDVILVMPGHAENISGGTSLVVDVAGVSIIGLGNADNRPVLTFTNTAGSIEMDAANTRLSNIVLLASVSAVVVGVNVDADNVEIDHCLFDYDETGDDFVIGIDVDAVDFPYIHDNYFRAEAAAAGADHAIRLDDCAYPRIIDNVITGDFTGYAIVGEGAAITEAVIVGNVIQNRDTTVGGLIDLHDDSTGVIAGNHMATLYATNITAPFDPGDCLCVENYIVNAVDETAAVSPTTAST